MKKQSTIQKDFNGIILNVTPDDRYEFTLTTEEVAKGYGVGVNIVHNQKMRNSEEFIEGKHYFPTLSKRENGNLTTKQTLWSKKGIVRLGFFIKSERARLFRDWIEDLIIERLQSAYSADSMISDTYSDMLSCLASDICLKAYGRRGTRKETDALTQKMLRALCRVVGREVFTGISGKRLSTSAVAH